MTTITTHASTADTSTDTRNAVVHGVVWWALAACRDVDPETFYPIDLTVGSDGVRAARRVCAGCPVRLECLTDVMASEDPARRWGVIGGATPDERAALYARQHPRTADAGAVAA